MPFEIITDPVIRHKGRARPNERVTVVLSTRTTLVFSVIHDRNRRKRLRLEPSWPKAVQDAATDLARSLSRKGRPPDMTQMEALVPYEELLIVGQPVRLTVSYGRQATLTRDVVLRGTVRDFVMK